jgi:hypothetical protein
MLVSLSSHYKSLLRIVKQIISFRSQIAIDADGGDAGGSDVFYHEQLPGQAFFGDGEDYKEFVSS